MKKILAKQSIRGNNGFPSHVNFSTSHPGCCSFYSKVFRGDLEL